MKILWDSSYFNGCVNEGYINQDYVDEENILTYLTLNEILLKNKKDSPTAHEPYRNNSKKKELIENLNFVSTAQDFLIIWAEFLGETDIIFKKKYLELILKRIAVRETENKEVFEQYKKPEDAFQNFFYDWKQRDKNFFDLIRENHKEDKNREKINFNKFEEEVQEIFSNEIDFKKSIFNILDSAKASMIEKNYTAAYLKENRIFSNKAIIAFETFSEDMLKNISLKNPEEKFPFISNIIRLDRFMNHLQVSFYKEKKENKKEISLVFPLVNDLVATFKFEVRHEIDFC